MSISQNFPNTRPSLNLNFARSKTLDPRITFIRTSTGTYVDESGFIRDAAADEPRFDHDPITGECLGLIIEEQRENLVTYSEQFDNVAWTSTYYTVGIDSTTAPDGTTSAEKLIRNTQNTQSQISRNITGTSTNTTYTLSCFCKSAEWSKIGLREGVSTGNWATFDLSLGEEIDSDIDVTTTIDSYPDEWYRISMTMTTTGTQTSYGVRIIPLPDSYTSGTPYVNQVGNDVDGLYLWGAQLEAGAFPTSYIPTTNQTVSRGKEYPIISGTNFTDFYNSSEGTIYVRYSMKGFGTNSTGFNRIFEISDGGSANRFSPLLQGQNQNIYEFGWDGTLDFNNSPITFGDFYTYIAGYKENDFQRYAIDRNGNIDSNTDTSVTVSSFTPTELNIGHQADGDSRILNGYISQLIYYPTRLSNSQLQTLLLQ